WSPSYATADLSLRVGLAPATPAALAGRRLVGFAVLATDGSDAKRGDTPRFPSRGRCLYVPSRSASRPHLVGRRPSTPSSQPNLRRPLHLGPGKPAALAQSARAVHS